MLEMHKSFGTNHFRLISRLFSSAVYNDNFPQFSVPEMQRKPVDDLLLQMKAMSIHKVVNFPFPSPPDRVQLKVAERKLQWLGALPLPKPGATEDGKSRLSFIYIQPRLSLL